MITETEAYEGFFDKASHAHRGLTPRNAPMFGLPGYWYVYLVYGMYWMLNIVTGPKGHPAAVLLRSVEGVAGPGRLSRKAGISSAHNRLPASVKGGLWLEDRKISLPPRAICRGSRVGVAYAGEWAHKPYRFWINEKKLDFIKF